MLIFRRDLRAVCDVELPDLFLNESHCRLILHCTRLHKKVGGSHSDTLIILEGTWSIDWSIGQFKSWLNWLIANEIPIGDLCGTKVALAQHWRWASAMTEHIGSAELMVHKTFII